MRNFFFYKLSKKKTQYDKFYNPTIYLDIFFCMTAKTQKHKIIKVKIFNSELRIQFFVLTAQLIGDEDDSFNELSTNEAICWPGFLEDESHFIRFRLKTRSTPCMPFSWLMLSPSPSTIKTLKDTERMKS